MEPANGGIDLLDFTTLDMNIILIPQFSGNVILNSSVESEHHYSPVQLLYKSTIYIICVDV